MNPSTEVILDTNVIVSAIIFPDSMGREIMELVEAGEFSLVIPDYIRREVLEVINRDFPDFNEVVDTYISKASEKPELPSVKNVKLCMEYLDDLEDSPIHNGNPIRFSKKLW